VSDERDEIVLRHLDGTASREEVRRLDGLVRHEKETRRALLLSAALDAGLHEVLATDLGARRPDRGSRRLVAVLAAAAVLLFAGGVTFVAGRYPGPRASGSFTIAGGGEVRRGAAITAGAPSAALTLGGYCRVALEPGSTVRIEGETRAEQVFLERGAAECSADRDVGTFAVRTPVGTVSVKGTRFTVRVVESGEEDAMFETRMVVRVLSGVVLVSGGWGGMLLQAGEEAALPPPQAAVQKILAGLDLPESERKRFERMVSVQAVDELREVYRIEGRRLIFDAARDKLRATMPKVMPKKMPPKIQALRLKLRDGPPSRGDLARLALVMRRRAREQMGTALHDTADRLIAAALQDERLVAWLVAKGIRAGMSGETAAAFDKALAAAGITDRERPYVVEAEAAIDAAVRAYDPDITGILDPETGRLVIREADHGVPVRDEAMEARVENILRRALAGIDLTGKDRTAVDGMLGGEFIDAERVAYCARARVRLFDAARAKQQDLLPRAMPEKVQAKVTAIRTGANSGGPASDLDRARIERAVTERTRKIMMRGLHDTADALAVKAAADDLLVAASLAKKIRAKLPADQVKAFDDAVVRAGLTGDESTYLAQAAQRTVSAIQEYDPDLTGIVDPQTGEVIVGD